MARRLIFTPEAEEQLATIFGYIAVAASVDIATGYTEAIIAYCERLRPFPHVGTLREDIRPGLRTVSYKKRVVIAFTADAEQVSIIGIFYGGQDYASHLQDDDDD
jgi:toxin ParE1/3/4